MSRERANLIASPLALKMLDLFGALVMEAFDDAVGVYLVGSALTRLDHRDVDVRAILLDEDFAHRFGSETDWRRNRSLQAHNFAFSALGNEVTKLPIDFQVEQMSAANAENDGPRHPLGHLVAAGTSDFSSSFEAPKSEVLHSKEQLMSTFARLNERQIDVLANVAFGGDGGGCSPRTLRALERRGLICSYVDEMSSVFGTLRITKWRMPIPVHIEFCAWVGDRP
jgi:hypothetical protein